MFSAFNLVEKIRELDLRDKEVERLIEDLNSSISTLAENPIEDNIRQTLVFIKMFFPLHIRKITARAALSEISSIEKKDISFDKESLVYLSLKYYEPLLNLDKSQYWVNLKAFEQHPFFSQIGLTSSRLKEYWDTFIESKGNYLPARSYSSCFDELIDNINYINTIFWILAVTEEYLSVGSALLKDYDIHKRMACYHWAIISNRLVSGNMSSDYAVRALAKSLNVGYSLKPSHFSNILKANDKTKKSFIAEKLYYAYRIPHPGLNSLIEALEIAPLYTNHECSCTELSKDFIQYIEDQQEHCTKQLLWRLDTLLRLQNPLVPSLTIQTVVSSISR